MREYELTVVYDLSVAEAGGQQAAVDRLSASVVARGGEVLKVDHWGRRRMAYPIKSAIDGDYVVSRVNLEPSAVNALEAALKIDERVYRHLVVRADELPAPPPPREPRAPRRMAEDTPAPAAAEDASEASAAATSEVATAEAEPATADAASEEAPSEPDETPAGADTVESAEESETPAE
jgi:small subunit ribosomal protein S6